MTPVLEPAPDAAAADAGSAPPHGYLLLSGAALEPRERKLHSRVRLLALRGLLQGPPGALPPRSRRSLAALQAQLRLIAAARPAPLLAALQRPALEGPALCLDAGVGEPGALWAALAPTLLAALAGAVDEALLWEGEVDELLLPDGDLLRPPRPFTAVSADRAGISVELDGQIVPLAAAPGARRASAHPIRPGLALGLIDRNPVAMHEDHPEKDGNALRLDGRAPEVWAAALDEALGIIDAGLPGWLQGPGQGLAHLLPVGFEPERHLSASYRELPSQAYLSLHPDPLTLAEAIVHEAQHGRLNRLLLLDPALRNGRSAWTPSPVRPDLRPLIGVLLAVHAFIPVAAMHRGLADRGHPAAQGPGFARRRAQVLQSDAHGMQILAERGEWTPAGAQLFGDLGALLAWAAEGRRDEVGDINQIPG
jgi:HEXXH motif-containing protein